MARTFGETQDCAGCRYWSEMCAQVIGSGPVEALCLGPGEYAGKYVTARMTCDAWKCGHLGAVDSPPDYGEAVRAASAREDNAPKNSQKRFNMPINVSIKTRPGRKDYAFTWVATSDEARSLWDRCEEMATEQGHEAHEIASGVIQQFYKQGELKSENERRGLKVWVVYAVLRNAVNHIDPASMVEEV
jgi:hypothetical protein